MISIISSIYKSDKYLNKYLIDIYNFSQYLEEKNIDFEFIVIANDPTEKEKQKISNFIKNNNFLKFYKIPREPLYASWNRGINLSQGEIISFWNVDDKRYSQAVVKALNLIKSGVELVYFPFIYKRYIKILDFPILVKKIVVRPIKFDKEKFSKEMHCGPFFMFTKDLYKKVGQFNETFKIAGDFDWCVRAAQITNFQYCDTVAGEFINEGTSLSGSKNILQKQENQIILNKNL